MMKRNERRIKFERGWYANLSHWLDDARYVPPTSRVYSDHYECPQFRYNLCGQGVRQLFDIPRGHMGFDLVLSKHPHKEAHKLLRLHEDGHLHVEWAAHKSGIKKIYLPRNNHQALKRFGMPCYVRLEIDDTSGD